jgi:hypothetical protein
VKVPSKMQSPEEPEAILAPSAGAGHPESGPTVRLQKNVACPQTPAAEASGATAGEAGSARHRQLSQRDAKLRFRDGRMKVLWHPGHAS